MSTNPHPHTQIKRFVIIGAGAVGGSIGGLLSIVGHDVVLIARGDHGITLQNNPLLLRTTHKEHHINFPCFERPNQIHWRSGDVAILSTKLQGAELALDDLLVAAGPDIPIVCATNGIHAEQWAAARFNSVQSMLVWLPATHLVPGEVRLHSAGSPGVLDIGPTQPTEDMSLAQELCACLRSAGFDSVARNNIQRWKHAKWIVNLSGAAEAMVLDDWRRVATAARAEGEDILRAAGMDPVPQRELASRVKSVGVEPVGGESRKGGSTWQSRARGKPLETQWIEGAIASLAAEIGFPAPINTYLAEASKEPRALSAAEVLNA